MEFGFEHSDFLQESGISVKHLRPHIFGVCLNFVAPLLHHTQLILQQRYFVLLIVNYPVQPIVLFFELGGLDDVFVLFLVHTLDLLV